MSACRTIDVLALAALVAVTLAALTIASRPSDGGFAAQLVLAVAGGQLTLLAAAIVFGSRHRGLLTLAIVATLTSWAGPSAAATGHAPTVWAAWWIVHVCFALFALAAVRRVARRTTEQQVDVARFTCQLSLASLLFLMTAIAGLCGATRWLMAHESLNGSAFLMVAATATHAALVIGVWCAGGSSRMIVGVNAAAMVIFAALCQWLGSPAWQMLLLQVVLMNLAGAVFFHRSTAFTSTRCQQLIFANDDHSLAPRTGIQTPEISLGRRRP